MTVIQSSVVADPVRALAGQAVFETATPNEDRVSGLAEVAIPSAGLVVVDGTDEGEVRLPTSTGQISSPGPRTGVVAHLHSREVGANVADVAGPVTVVRKGKRWLYSETSITRGSHPFVRHVAAGAEVLGRIRNDADGSDATQAYWITVLESRTGAGLVPCEIELPLSLITVEA